MHQKLADEEHSFRWTMPVDEALSIQLYKECLSWKLTDLAEYAAIEQFGQWFHEQEVQTSITCDGKEFVVEFKWEGALPAETPCAQ